MDVDEVIRERINLSYLADSLSATYLTQFLTLLPGGVYHGMPHIQEPHKRLLCSQEQGPCPQQTRPVPEAEREACLVTGSLMIIL
jgi:hypothetical protein